MSNQLVTYLVIVTFINISRIKSSILETNKQDFENSESSEQIRAKTFQLENCDCRRTLTSLQEYDDSPAKFEDTTCGRDAFQRGSRQKVAGFSFYGNTSSSAHKAKKYFSGIQENLKLLRSEYGEGWSLRLYYDLPRYIL